MAKFSVLSNGSLVGHSHLELGDPPMGVAFGEFFPAPGYAAISRHCRTNHSDRPSLELSVQTEQGTVIPCVGVGILDYSAETSEPYIEINVLGIEYSVYQALFPQHITSYEQQFKD